MLPGINVPFEYLRKLTGANIGEVKLLASFLISYPLAAGLKRVPDRNYLKQIYIIAVALFYMVGLFDLYGGLVTIFWSAGATYAISYYIDGSLMPWIAFTWLMTHMSINHITRQQLNDPSDLDITGMQMVMLMKLSAFAWNVHDGRLKRDGLSEMQKEKAIYKMPSFLDYTAYVMFFPSLFTGPAFDYNDYRSWVDGSMFETKDSKDKSVAPTSKGTKVPRSGNTSAWKLVEGLIWIAMYIVLGPVYTPQFLSTDKYWSYSFFYRVWIMVALAFVSRLKYYGTWSLTEGACILTGLGYNGIDEKTKRAKWDRLNNVNPWAIETAQNPKGYLDNWNKNTNHWLKNYIYLRVTPKGKKPGFRATLATFSTSALWHGFYPGYYFTFVSGAFVQTVAKNFRRYIRPFFLTSDGKKGSPNKIYYDIVCWLVTQLTFSFIVAPFVILGFNDSIRAWASVYFYGIAGVAASMIFFASPAKAYLKKKVEQRTHPDALKRVASERSMPSLGIVGMEDIDNAIDEIKDEVEARRRRGSKVEFPSGDALKSAITNRIWLRKQEGHDVGGPGNPRFTMNIDEIRREVGINLTDGKKVQ